jgi:hypothetical protein
MIIAAAVAAGSIPFATADRGRLMRSSSSCVIAATSLFGDSCFPPGAKIDYTRRGLAGKLYAMRSCGTALI